MKELDFLKQDWKKQDRNLPHLSYDDIYKMLWKKSSSIVKWIFIISILELFLSTFFSIVLADENYWRQMDELGLRNFTVALYILSYSVTFYFIFRFYKNYRRISITDNAATLMRNIIKTRRTVKTYIAYVLIFSGISGMIVTIVTIRNHRSLSEPVEMANYNYETLDWVKFILISTIFMIIFLGLIWLFYRLIYGILLKKLLRNYKELRKLEV